METAAGGVTSNDMVLLRDPTGVVYGGAYRATVPSLVGGRRKQKEVALKSRPYQKQLLIPAGLFCLNVSSSPVPTREEGIEADDTVVSDSLFDKLLHLAVAYKEEPVKSVAAAAEKLEEQAVAAVEEAAVEEALVASAQPVAAVIVKHKKSSRKKKPTARRHPDRRLTRRRSKK